MPYCHDQARRMPLIFLLAISQIDDQPGSLHVNTSEVKASQDLVSGVINFNCYKIERFFLKLLLIVLETFFRHVFDAITAGRTSSALGVVVRRRNEKAGQGRQIRCFCKAQHGDR